MVEHPTLLLLHGGPGLDHATYKLGLHELSENTIEMVEMVRTPELFAHWNAGLSDPRCNWSGLKR